MVIKLEHILVVEDDCALANGLCRALMTSEIQAENCGTLEEAGRRLAAWKQKEMPLLLLDVNLPDGNGLDFLKKVKEAYHIPVIMLTANDMEVDIVAGLEQGAEDYITKPFSLAVLRARVAAVLRRRQREALIEEARRNQAEELERELPEMSSGALRALQDRVPREDGQSEQLSHTAADRSSDSQFVFDAFDFDFERMVFHSGKQKVELSKTEQKLLWCFMKNRGIILSRDTLIDRIWTDGAEYVDENALSVAVKRLRDKLSARQYIKTIYGIGYVWKKE